MVAESNGLIAHLAHDVDDVLAPGDGPRSASLKEVTAADDTDEGRIAALDGITKACQMGIAVDAAVDIVLIEDYDTLGLLPHGSSCRTVLRGGTAAEQGYGYAHKDMIPKLMHKRSLDC